MKCWLLALALPFLLCGCAYTRPENSFPAADSALPVESTSFEPSQETTMPQETEPEVWEEGSVEAQTNGALLSWEFSDQLVTGICFMGQELLVFYDTGGTTQLRLLSPADMSIKAGVELNDLLTYSQQSWVVTDDTFAYFSKNQKAVVVLDAQLTQVASIPVSQEIKHQVVITRDLKAAYYSDGGGIYSLNLETGESALLAHVGEYVVHLNLLFNDAVLSWIGYSSNTGYLSAQTGQVIGSDHQADDIAAGGDRYFLSRVEDDYNEYLFGTFGSEHTALMPSKSMTYTYMGYLTDLHGAVFKGYPNGYDINSQWTFFDYYDLTTGKRISAIDADLGYVEWLSTVTEDPSGKYLWFAARSIGTEEKNTRIYRWELGATLTGDDQVYTGTRHTESNPDMDGIARCRARAAALAEAYNVDILVYDEAKFPQGYGFRYLYQAHIIDEYLDRLEAALASFPEGFLKALGTVSQNGRLQFSIAGRNVINYDYYYDSMLHWNNGNACIALGSIYSNGRTVYRGVGFALEEFLKHAGCLGSWETYNPDGFQYYGSFAAAKAGEHNMAYFIDQNSMASRAADVAVMFEYAMMDDCNTHIHFYIMQKKLALLCESIREAFNLAETTQILPWEKYLAGEE